MKKIISTFIVFVLMFSIGITSYAGSQSEFRTDALGIFEPVENGEFLQKEYVTRADMAVIICRLTGGNDSMHGEYANRFTDVSESHWANKYINSYNIYGIINGYDDGTFKPDSFVKYEDAVKMLVSLLSYDKTANDLGGYPEGYVAAAGFLRVLKGVNFTLGDLLDAANVKVLVGNALEAHPMETLLNNTLEVSDSSLYEILSERRELSEASGVLTATEFTSITSPSLHAGRGCVIIDGKEYRTEEDYTAFLGYYVKAYFVDDGGSIPVIADVFPVEKYNNLITAPAENVNIYFNYADVLDEDDETTEYLFDDSVMFVYNGKSTYLEKQIYYGDYSFLDNNDDELIDVVFIREAESFIVDRINERNNTLYFAEEKLFHGVNSFTFDYGNKNKNYVLKSTGGEEIEFADIAVGDGVTIYASEDENCVTAIVSKERIAGEITETNDEWVKVENEEYKIARDSQGNFTISLELGDKGTFVIDALGNIAGTDGDKETDYLFGYVSGVDKKTGLRGNLQIKVVVAGKPNKEVTVKNGTETIKQHFMNSGFEVYEFSSKVVLNGSRVDSENINPSVIENNVIAFTLNSEGKIKELDTYSVPNANSLESHLFNAKIVSFGGKSRGYMTNSATQIICVPNDADEDDDYLVQLTLNDGSSSHKVYGVSLDALSMVGTTQEEIEYIESLPVDVLVIRADMDSKESKPIQNDADICIVGKVTQTINVNERGEEDIVYKIELLNRDKIVTEVTAPSGRAFELASKLRKGDLIRYNKDGYNQIASLELLESVQGLKNYGQTHNGGFYGLVNEADLYMYDYRNNAMIDRVLLFYNEYSDIDVIRILREEGPPVYLYERDSGWIYSATADDIVSNDTKLYVYKPHGVEEVIVIIED